MIIFSKALADQATVWEALRASETCQNLPPDLLRFSAQTKPVVMWNLTRRCNLACQHCYMDASREARDEMSLEEGMHLVDDLAELKVPILIFTGGEPLLSRNFYASGLPCPRGGPAHGHLHQWNTDNSRGGKAPGRGQDQVCGGEPGLRHRRSGTTPSGALPELMPGPCRA